MSGEQQVPAATEAEREALAEVLDPIAFQEAWVSPSRQREAQDAARYRAGAVLAAGYRRLHPGAGEQGDVVAALRALDWRLTKDHHPVGAYLPVGQLDGDCSCGDGEWPCETYRAALAASTQAGGA